MEQLKCLDQWYQKALIIAMSDLQYVTVEVGFFCVFLCFVFFLRILRKLVLQSRSGALYQFVMQLTFYKEPVGLTIHKPS